MMTMTVANEGKGNNTTTNNGSLLCSSFSLRPPLPPGNNDGVISASNNNNHNNHKNDDDIQIRHKRQKIVSKKKQQQHDNFAIKSSFISRMYIACHILQVKTETRFTAIVLLHRYAQSKNKNSKRGNNNKNEVGDDNNNNEYENDDDNDNDEWPWIGAVCLFLACKTEEEPRRLRDVINMARMVLSSSSMSKDIDNEHNNSKNVLCMNLTTPPSLNEEAYWDSKRKAIETESIVLRWLGFDCSVSHPHRAVYWILEKEIEVWQQLLLLSKSKSIQNQAQKTAKEVTTTQTSSSLLDEKNIRLTHPIPAGKQNYDNAAAADNNNHGTDNFNHSNDDESFNINDNNNNGSTVTILRDKLLLFSFRRLNDALFYPTALQWGIVEMACAALDLAVHRLEEVENGNNDDVDGTSNDTTTLLIHNNKDSSIKNNSSISNKSFFKKEWWKRYGVCNESFDGCRDSLKEATSYLENLSTTTTTSTASIATT